MSRDFTVTLKQLTISPDNVRANEETDTTSWKRRSLPIPSSSTGRAGEGQEPLRGDRRPPALPRLRAIDRREKVHKDFPIKVTLAPEAIVGRDLFGRKRRTGSHAPADEFETFRALIEEKGLSREALAERFGLTLRHIDRRLKLAKVSAAVRDAYRKGDLTLLQVEAFAVTDDHARQDHYLENAGHWNASRTSSAAP